MALYREKIVEALEEAALDQVKLLFKELLLSIDTGGEAEDAARRFSKGLQVTEDALNLAHKVLGCSCQAIASSSTPRR